MHIQQATSKESGSVLQCMLPLNIHGVDFFTSKRVKHLVKKHCVGIVVEGSEVLGACILKPEEGNTLEIFALSIRPEYQKRGVGSKLIKWSEAMASGIGASFLYANSYEFYKASDFYHRNDFVTISRVKDTPSYYYTFAKLV